MQNFREISLNGLWDFFYSPQKFTPVISSLPLTEEYSGQMIIPGYWDDHYELFDEEDFFGLTARFNPDYRKPHFPMGMTLTPHAASSFMVGTGFYRKIFTVNENFKSVTLSVGPAMWGCCVYCNGNFAGQITGYSTQSSYILDDFIKKEEENELVIVVCNLHDDGGAYHRIDESHDGIPFGTRPGQHRGLAAQGYQSERGGINGGISLKISPGAQFTDHFISFQNGIPLWHIETRGGKSVLIWKISQNGNIFDSGSVEIDNFIEFTSAVPPILWSDKNPALCNVELILKNGDVISDHIEFKWGARELTVNKMSLELNGIPTFFRGVTEHCYFPETTNPHYDKEKYLRDLAVLKKAGFNFIRCHTWCPPEPFYQACDELGFLVQTELIPVWDFDEAENIIKHIRKHTCAVILCEGNEKIIDETAILRMQKLVKMLHKMAPGMLFNPQEAMRGIEYEFTPGRKIINHPLEHDPERLDRVRKFADCFGTLGGEFSYDHDTFPGREKIELRNDIYRRPCLSHEIGILGGYLDFSLEERYKNTYIGTDLFNAAREHMSKHGVYQLARKYYEKNTLFITSCRKQLIENLRSCRNMAGFDYLGGIDTHWHLIGYPCGIFNEFYEEKFQESIADIRRYCGESILLCSAGNRRNRISGKLFSENIEFVCYETDGINNGLVTWSFETLNGKCISSGSEKCCSAACGSIIPAAKVEFKLPDTGNGCACILRASISANGKIWDNCWNFWSFPAVKNVTYDNVKICTSLSAELIDFMENGGNIVLTANFPSTMFLEYFRSHTSGRSLGHAGALINPHPIWERFPHNEFLDWQFFPMMMESQSMIYDDKMPQFKPIFELIPSFKMVKHKSLLSEFTVGKGRMIITGFRFDNDDPAANYMMQIIAEYLAGKDFAPAPSWDVNDLRDRVKNIGKFKRLDKEGRKVDAGGRPVN